ncbi:hypothetical protein D3Q16_26740 [Salmonella enterica]|nr:hypothetical protein [Salmonella enterica]
MKQPIRGKNRDLPNAIAVIGGVQAQPARLQLNMHPELHDLFKNISFNNREVMSDLITDFVIGYVRSNGIEIDQATEEHYKDKPVKWLTTNPEFFKKK